MDTIKKVLEEASRGGDFDLLLGDFLDAFYRSEKPARQEMINGCPFGAALQNRPEHLAFAAASAHKLANDYGLSVPAWVFDRQFYSGKPFFGCGAKGTLRLLFMYQSPSEFKHRNLFVDENVLARV